MSTTNTIAKVFETVLSIPGMNDNVKIQLSISRKNVLLLSKIIERGLAGKNGLEDDHILAGAPADFFEELKTIPDNILRKAGLIEMNEKLKMF